MTTHQEAAMRGPRPGDAPEGATWDDGRCDERARARAALGTSPTTRVEWTPATSRADAIADLIVERDALRALLDGDEKPPFDRTATEYLAWAVPHWRKRARAAEAKVAAVEALADEMVGREHERSCYRVSSPCERCAVAERGREIRAALATTGEGE